MARQKKEKEQVSKYKHIEYIDVNDDGVKEEVAVVKRWEDGTISYIDIAPLDPIDKGRLKKIITGTHADKYELWELLNQARLTNGMNALDFFHSNFMKVKRTAGSNNTSLGGGLNTVKASGGETMIGSEYTNPAEAEVDDSGKFQ